MQKEYGAQAFLHQGYHPWRQQAQVALEVVLVEDGQRP